MTKILASRSIGQRALAISEEVVSAAAADVDRRARFPKESIDALREEQMLSLLVPTDLGGQGASLSQVSEVATLLGRASASSAMVFAMHRIQVACLVRHGHSAFIRSYLHDRVVGDQALLASATTEINIGGDVRTSHCAVEAGSDRFQLRKTAPVISYGEYADAVLATTRRGPDSPSSDQVLVLCERPGLTLDPVGEWDAMGFRGTCSLGFELSAEGPLAAVLPDPYAQISQETMLPVSHVLWASVWLGIADTAVRQARARVRTEARRHPGTTPPSAPRLAEVMAIHQQMTALVRSASRHYDEIADDAEALGDMDFALEMNGLKVAASGLVLDIATRALAICGIDGYREDSPKGLGRVVRDAHGAALMVNNDRIIGHSAQMLLVSKEA